MKKSGVMAGSATAMRASEDNGTTDPFAAAKEKLFPPLRHRILAQAADALAENRADVAEPLVSTFLKKHPTEPGAVNLMADIARRAGQFDKAEELLSKCIQQSPDCAGYKFNYAVILRNLGRFEQALVQLDTLLVTDPKNPLVRDQKAKVLHDMGRNADAVAYRRGLSSDHPAWPGRSTEQRPSAANSASGGSGARRQSCHGVHGQEDRLF